jgi:hypothetical protein
LLLLCLPFTIWASWVITLNKEVDFWRWCLNFSQACCSLNDDTVDFFMSSGAS